MNYSMTFISPLVAEKFNQELPGCPTENRVLILSPKEVNQTKSGLIIPEQVKEGVPRKGVVVKSGEITEEYKTNGCAPGRNSRRKVSAGYPPKQSGSSPTDERCKKGR